MKLGEILKSIDLRRPNAFPEETKICFINSIIRQWGHIIGKSQEEEFVAEEGVFRYPLPEGVEGDGIKAVEAGGERLEPIRYDEEMRDGTYKLEPAGFIILNGVAAGKKVKIIYNECKEFKGFDGDDYLEADCGVYDSFADILVYGALYQLADADEDINAAANYKERMSELISFARQGRYLKHGKYPVVRGKSGKWQRF